MRGFFLVLGYLIGGGLSYGFAQPSYYANPFIEQTEVCPNPSEGCQPETDICDFSDLYCATNDGCYCAASKDTCIG